MRDAGIMGRTARGHIGPIIAWAIEPPCAARRSWRCAGIIWTARSGAVDDPRDEDRNISAGAALHGGLRRSGPFYCTHLWRFSLIV